MSKAITTFATYGSGIYHLAADLIASGNDSLIFTDTAVLDLNGYKIIGRTKDNAWTHGVQMRGKNSALVDRSGGLGLICGFRVGAKLTGEASRVVDVNLSGNRYFGVWLAAAHCRVLGGVINNTGGVTDEAYAIAIQCDSASPIVEGVTIRNTYRQNGCVGTGEGLPVNFAATCTNGIMQDCIAENDEACSHTYGVFGGEGGSHKIRRNQFVNFWRAVACSNVGTPEISHNVAWLQEPLPKATGFGCEVSNECLVSGNVAIGYLETPYDGATPRARNAMFGTRSVFAPTTQRPSQAEPASQPVAATLP